MDRDELLKMAMAFHGHKCPAMPLGIRAALAAMDKLGAQRAGNSELYLISDSGKQHAMSCFVDGLQAATGCTAVGHINTWLLGLTALGSIAGAVLGA